MPSRSKRGGECRHAPIPKQEKVSAGERPARGKAGGEPLPWDSMLRFRDAALEEEYWASHCDFVKLALDVAWMVMGVCVGLGFLARTRQASSTSAMGSAEIGTLIATRALTIMLAWKCRAFYKSNRVLIATFLRLQCVVYSVRMFAAPPSLAWTPWGLARHLVQKCVLIPLVSVIGGLRLTFAEHFFAQGTGCLIGLLWTTEMFCQSWVGPGGYGGLELSAFSAVGRTIDSMIVQLTTYGYPWPAGSSTAEPGLGEGGAGEAYSCWLVVAFFQVLGAFVLPTMFLYSVESACRARFLMARTADDDERKACAWAWLHTVFVMVWLGLMTLVVAWLGLKSLEEIWRQAAAIAACPDGAQCMCDA